MDFTNIITVISNVGFPICMCLVLLFYLRESDKKHDEEVAHLREALNNNTLVMQQLISKLDPS